MGYFAGLYTLYRVAQAVSFGRYMLALFAEMFAEIYTVKDYEKDVQHTLALGAAAIGMVLAIIG